MITENAANPLHIGGVSERLRSFMTTHSLTDGELARLFGIPPETLEEWLNAEAPPPGALLALLILRPMLLSEKGIPSVSRTTSPGCSYTDNRPSTTQEQQLLRMVRAI